MEESKAHVGHGWFRLLLPEAEAAPVLLVLVLPILPVVPVWALLSRQAAPLTPVDVTAETEVEAAMLVLKLPAVEFNGSTWLRWKPWPSR